MMAGDENAPDVSGQTSLLNVRATLGATLIGRLVVLAIFA